MRPSWHAEAIALYDKNPDWSYGYLGSLFGVTRFAVYRAVNKSATANNKQKRTRKARNEYLRVYMQRYRQKAKGEQNAGYGHLG